MNNDRLVYAEHKNRFSSIGVDLFRDTQTEDIWRIEHNSEDNADYIVRTDMVDTSMQQQSSSSNWKSVSDRTSTNITLFYKDTPVKRFSSDVYGFDSKTAANFGHFLVQRAEDPLFVKKMFQTLPEAKVNMILEQHMELKR